MRPGSITVMLSTSNLVSSIETFFFFPLFKLRKIQNLRNPLGQLVFWVTSSQKCSFTFQPLYSRWRSHFPHSFYLILCWQNQVVAARTRFALCSSEHKLMPENWAPSSPECSYWIYFLASDFLFLKLKILRHFQYFYQTSVINFQFLPTINETPEASQWT